MLSFKNIYKLIIVIIFGISAIVFGIIAQLSSDMLDICKKAVNHALILE